MRLMFLGDRMWGTSGYSRVVYNFCTRLTSKHQVAHIPMAQSMQGGKMSYQGVLIYPSGRDPFGEEVAYQSYIDFAADMLITVKEPWVFNRMSGLPVNWVPMAIIDHSPVSPHITSKIANAFKVIAISKFGQAEMKNAPNPVDSYYIPHGVDIQAYRPLGYDKKKLCKKLWQLPDDFTVGIVALNRSRKLITRMLRGYRRFIDTYPDIKTHLMLWSNLLPQGLNEEMTPGVADVGVDIIQEVMNLGLNEVVIWPEDRVITEGVIPEWSGEDYVGGWDMVKLYNSFDVLFHCTPGYGRVTTEKGYKRIKYVRVGDRVLTHDGTFRCVLETFQRDYDGDLVTIETMPKYEIAVTPEHPILILKQSGIPSHRNDYDWIQAKDVKEGQYAVISKPNFTSIRKETLQISSDLKQRSRKILPNKLHVTRELLRLFAYYISEGTSMDDGTIIFSLGPKDQEIEKDIFDICKKYSFLNVTVRSIKKKNFTVRRLSTYSVAFSQILKSNCGRRSHHKKLPEWLFNIKDERKTKHYDFIRALWKGDGYVNDKAAEYTTVSRRLSEDLQIYLMKLGFLPSVQYNRRRKSYNIRIQGKQLIKFSKIIGVKLGNTRNRRYQFWVKGLHGNFLVPITKIGHQKYKGKVYNLKVESNESYSLPLVTHNCTGGEGFGLPLLEAQACGVSVITTDYAAGPELVGSGFIVKSNDYIIISTPGTRYALPDIDGMAEALKKAYDLNWKKSAVKARLFAERYSWEKVINDYMQPFLEECEKEIRPKVTSKGVEHW